LTYLVKVDWNRWLEEGEEEKTFPGIGNAGMGGMVCFRLVISHHTLLEHLGFWWYARYERHG